MAYNYDPAAVAEYGKDRMRFELGDTMVEGGPDTTALTDDEIVAVIRRHIGDVTDELCGKIASKLEEVFANMPLKGVGV